jgi:hypothetical protein
MTACYISVCERVIHGVEKELGVEKNCGAKNYWEVLSFLGW